jgi:hypothetical protein
VFLLEPHHIYYRYVYLKVRTAANPITQVEKKNPTQLLRYIQFIHGICKKKKKKYYYKVSFQNTNQPETRHLRIQGPEL